MSPVFLLWRWAELLFSYVGASHDDEEQDVEPTEADSFHSFFHSVRLLWSCRETQAQAGDQWHNDFTVGVSVDW